MSETHGHDAHHGPTFATYMTIFAALSFCTLLSFAVNYTLGQNFRSASIILVVAIIKAVLVGAVFMHLKYDWGKLYFLIMPVFVMATMMVMVLLPDIVFGWAYDLPAQVVFPESIHH